MYLHITNVCVSEPKDGEAHLYFLTHGEKTAICHLSYPTRPQTPLDYLFVENSLVRFVVEGTLGVTISGQMEQIVPNDESDFDDLSDSEMSEGEEESDESISSMDGTSKFDRHALKRMLRKGSKGGDDSDEEEEEDEEEMEEEEEDEEEEESSEASDPKKKLAIAPTFPRTDKKNAKQNKPQNKPAKKEEKTEEKPAQKGQNAQKAKGENKGNVPCPYCNRTFATEKARDDHVKQKHSEKKEEKKEGNKTQPKKVDGKAPKANAAGKQ